MTIMAKFFLALSVVTLAASFTGPGSEFLWGLLKPLGVIFFMLFLITRILAKEIDKFDAEEASRKARVGMAKESAAAAQSKRNRLLHSERTA